MPSTSRGAPVPPVVRSEPMSFCSRNQAASLSHGSPPRLRLRRLGFKFLLGDAMKLSPTACTLLRTSVLLGELIGDVGPKGACALIFTGEATMSLLLLGSVVLPPT